MFLNSVANMYILHQLGTVLQARGAMLSHKCIRSTMSGWTKSCRCSTGRSAAMCDVLVTASSDCRCNLPYKFHLLAGSKVNKCSRAWETWPVLLYTENEIPTLAYWWPPSCVRRLPCGGEQLPTWLPGWLQRQPATWLAGYT